MRKGLVPKRFALLDIQQSIMEIWKAMSTPLASEMPYLTIDQLNAKITDADVDADTEMREMLPLTLDELNDKITDADVHATAETVWNSTGGDIVKGTVLAPTGSITSGRRNVWEAQANASGVNVKRRGAFAVAAATIINGSDGPAVCCFELDDLDLSGFSQGDELWMSETQGLLTNEKPLVPSSQIRVGWVITAGASGKAWLEFKDLSWVGNVQAGVAALERTGFGLVNGKPVDTAGTAVSLSIDDPTMKLTISSVAGTFGVYSVNNLFFKVGNQDVNWTDVEGGHFFYFSSTGVFTHATAFDNSFIFGPNIFVAYLYWDATNKRTIFGSPLNEMHGLQQSGADHFQDHNILGSQVLGPGLSLNTLNVAGNGSVDSHAQFGVDSGQITDEDLIHPISSIGSTVGLPMLYNDGPSGVTRELSKAGFSVIDDISAGVGATGRLVWNEWTGATWQLTPVGVNKYVLCHVLAIGNATGGIAYSAIGQQEYLTAALAREGVETELGNLITQLPFVEVRPLASAIFQSGSYGNAVNGRIRPTDDGDYFDWRKDAVPGGVSFTPGTHNSLGGRSDIACHPATAVSVDATGFSGVLSSTDIDVQAALNTLDALNPAASLGFLHVRDETAQNTAKTTLTASTQNIRNINTVKYNSITGALLSGNKVTLLAGTYEGDIDARYRSEGNVGASILSLWDDTSSAYIAHDTEYSDYDFTGSDHAEGRASLHIFFTLSETKELEIHHYVDNSSDTGEPCNVTGFTEVRLNAIFNKLG